MVKKTREEALATRNAILDAAEIVFQEHGVGRTSLAEVAAAAGVTRGAVYWHFANKADLFDALIQRVVGQMEVQLDELQTRRHYDDPTEMMRELAFHFLDRMVNNPNFRRIIGICWHKCEYVGEMMKIRDKHIECDRRFLDICMTAFAASRERGFLSPCVDPRIAAIGLKAIIDGLVINWTLDPESFLLVETGTRIIDSYLAGLRGKRESLNDSSSPGSS